MSPAETKKEMITVPLFLKNLKCRRPPPCRKLPRSPAEVCSNPLPTMLPLTSTLPCFIAYVDLPLSQRLMFSQARFQVSNAAADDHRQESVCRCCGDTNETILHLITTCATMSGPRKILWQNNPPPCNTPVLLIWTRTFERPLKLLIAFLTMIDSMVFKVSEPSLPKFDFPNTGLTSRSRNAR